MTGRDAQAEHRTDGPRHAAPRTSGRKRARLLAFTAVPTALLMGGSVLPELASAATTTGTSCAPAANAPTTITQVPKSQLTPVPAPSAATATPSATKATPGAGTATPNTATATPSAKASAAGSAPVAGAAFVPPSAGPAAQQQAATAVTNQVVQADDSSGSGNLLGDIINGITGIFTPPHQQSTASPTPSAKPSSAPAAAPRIGAPATPSTAAPQPGASAPASPTAPTSGGTPSSGPSTPSASPSSSPSATPGASASGSPAPTASATPSGSPAPTAPSAVASALAGGDTRPLCPVDTSKVAAAAVQGGQVVPDQNWTLNTTRLALHGAVFGGVYEVHTPTTTKRVLKFTVSAVDIDNLDMSTIENTGHGSTPPETFHVKGAAGSTSTMVDGPITMYVESLSGELSALYGIPLPPLGTITLTPDTLPTWLYDLIGAVPIPLDITMTGVTAIQAGQFGGTLHIPGMQLFNDTAPYPYGH